MLWIYKYKFLHQPINPPLITGTKLIPMPLVAAIIFVFTQVAKLIHACVVACTGHDVYLFG